MSEFKFVPPKVLGHAVSIRGDALTVFEDECAVGKIAFDDYGCGPYVFVGGCPNCQKHADTWWDLPSYLGAQDAGADPNGPCSRVCQYQLEWAAELAARKATAA